jgi:Grx4 family monothiol glutaredoxin
MGTMMRDVGDEGGLANALSSASKSGVFFWASWHEPSKIGGQMDTVWGELARRHEGEVQFLRAEAEAFPESCDKFGISSVPAFALLHGEKLVELLEGADAPSLTAKVKSFAAAPASSSVGTNEPAKDSDVSASVDTTERIKQVRGAPDKVCTVVAEANFLRLSAHLQLIKTDKVMLFMKGTPSEPKCKFSRRILAILQGVGIQFSSFNVLGDEDVRQGIKVYSDFPTFPQLYVHGELVGGIDIIQEMADSAAEGGDDLKVQLGLAGEDSMDDRCRKVSHLLDVVP